jgi:hypothetical protein
MYQHNIYLQYPSKALETPLLVITSNQDRRKYASYLFFSLQQYISLRGIFV